MEQYGLITAGGDPRDLEAVAESMWWLGIGGGDGNGSSGVGVAPYPERPGEPDCAYYMRTGACSYGERCRYNHPLDRENLVIGAATLGSGEYPERLGHPFCEFYLKTGTCKFGSSCKFHHPRQGGGSVRPVSLNYYGYPLRPGTQLCAYYAHHGVCKFGPTCKFDHPIETLDCSHVICPLVGMPVAPYPTGVSQPTLAPYSSMELRPHFLPRKDSFSTQSPSLGDSPGGRFLCHSGIQSSSQMSTVSSGSTKGQTSEPSS